MRPTSEHEEVCEKLDLIVKAFKEINITPLEALASGCCVDFTLFCTLPPNIIHFVKSIEEVPSSKRVNRMRANGKDPEYHCDFTRRFAYSERGGFLDEGIYLNNGSLSVPDVSVRLWGYKDSNSQQILTTPNTAAFQLDVMRGMEGLKRGLENVVKNKLVEGVYVVVPEDTKQIDWQKDDAIVEKLKKSKGDYLYQWVANQ